MLAEEPSTISSRRRGIYLLPNLFTTAGLFAGFYSVVAALKGHYEIACMSLFVAMLMDGLDGRVARLTNTESEFGAEYDSLSDMVCFGVAPALLVYAYSLNHLNKFGWLCAFFYTAATALRLARFNVKIDEQDKKFFTGLPCPAAAAVIAGAVWIGVDLEFTGEALRIPMAAITLFVGSLMVSNILHYSFKEIDLKGKVSFFVILMILVTLVVVAWEPKVAYLALSAYVCSGTVYKVYSLLFKRKTK